MHPSFSLGSFSLPAFGLMMLFGMLAAFLLIFKNIRRTKITEDDFYSVAIIAISCGIVGAKLLYWIVEYKYILEHPLFLLETLTSGFVFYGSLIFGCLGIWVFCRKKHQSVFTYYDLISPSFAIGQAFGRIGCFLAGCCYGRPTDGPLGVVFPANPETIAPPGIPLLPTQLMESAFLFLLTIVLTMMYTRQRKRGTTTGWYFILYGIWRFIIEFFRSDERGAVLGLSTSQFIGLFIVAAGILILLFFRSNEDRPGIINVSRETSGSGKNGNDNMIIEIVREQGSGTAPVIESKKKRERR